MGVVRYELPDWRVAYRDGVATGHGKPWSHGFGPIEDQALTRALETHCPDRGERVAWIRREAELFARAVAPQASMWMGFAPRGFERWLGSGRPTVLPPAARAGRPNVQQDMVPEHDPAHPNFKGRIFDITKAARR